MTEERRLTERQQDLLQRMERLVWFGVAISVLGLPLAWLNNITWPTWVLAAAAMAIFLSIVLTGRALSRTGEPFSDLRWYWPRGVKNELRFGHKPWHRVAIVVAAVPFAYMALLMWAGGQHVASVICGAIAAGLLVLAYVFHRRFRTAG